MLSKSSFRDEADRVADSLLKHADGFSCRLIAVLLKDRRWLYAANVWESRIKDPKSSRRGLKLIYGFALSARLASQNESALRKGFRILHRYFADQFDLVTMNSEGLDRVVASFQDPEIGPEVVLGRSHLIELLRDLEDEFFFEQETRWRWPMSKKSLRLGAGKLALVRRGPCASMVSACRFWAKLDTDRAASRKWQRR